MDTSLVSARTLGTFCRVDGDRLGRAYKNVLSGFREWDQIAHAGDWVLLPQNIGPHLAIDETTIGDDVYTILSNRDAHGGRGTIVAIVRGTKCETVSSVLSCIPAVEREKVEEVTMDFSDSMRCIAEASFPKASIVIDVFHLMKLAVEAVEELRLKDKRQAVAEVKRQERDYLAKRAASRKRRKAYGKSHKATRGGHKRGRKPKYESRFRPPTHTNGDTEVELLTRSKYLLSMSGDKWTERQKARADILFEYHPKIKESHSLLCSLRSVFCRKTASRDDGREKLHQWYTTVTECTLREMKAVRDAIKQREDHVLNYFVNHSTNASAESLNSKLKSFRAQLRGISDLSFFLFRLTRVMG